MPDGGTLTFSTTLCTLGEDYCGRQPHDISPGEFLRVDVQDTGAGMDAETRRRLFEPFFTTKPKGKGTGLGLASVYGIVKQHRGAIHVYSEVGRGSCFSIYLPLSGESPEHDVTPPVIRERCSGRVLVVDDEELVAAGLAAALKRLGLAVDICHDGVEAVAFFSEHWRAIDLVILDLVMPRLGGKDTYRAMRLLNPQLKAIVASGFSVEGEAQSLLDEGAKGFLQKPIQQAELAGLVSSVIKGLG
jgi:CheY-like chemotaxis protein